MLHAIPNGARVSPTQARKLKAEGMRAGVPDLHLPMPRMRAIGFADDGGYWPGLYVEAKTRTGRLSEEQKEWRDYLISAGFAYRICRSADSIVSALIEYVTGQWSQTDNGEAA